MDGLEGSEGAEALEETAEDALDAAGSCLASCAAEPAGDGVPVSAGLDGSRELSLSEEASGSERLE